MALRAALPSNFGHRFSLARSAFADEPMLPGIGVRQSRRQRLMLTLTYQPRRASCVAMSLPGLVSQNVVRPQRRQTLSENFQKVLAIMIDAVHCHGR